MTKKVLSLLLALLVCFIALAGFASEVTLLPLEKVVNRETTVVVAKVDKIAITKEIHSASHEFAVSEIQVLNGSVAKGVERFVYVWLSPVIRDEEGNVICRISPILKISGIEHLLKAGERYIFFAEKQQPTSSVRVFRVEPEDKRSVVLRLLKKDE